MHIAFPLDNWLGENARYCNRYHARFTPATCAKTREKFGKERCAGCNGLEDQQRELERKEPVVIQDEPEPAECMTRALAGALQEILDGDDEELFTDADPEELDETVEDELNGFHHELLALLDDDLEEPVPERMPDKKGTRRFAVFMGRCPRCKGYILPAPERYDDIRDNEVMRCFNCGYRTSPGYQWNRHQVT